MRRVYAGMRLICIMCEIDGWMRMSVRVRVSLNLTCPTRLYEK